MDSNSQTTRSRLLAPSATYFGLVFAIGFLLGSIRVPFIVPRIGVRLAELLEMPVMLAASIWSAHFVVRRFGIPARSRIRLLIGGLAFVLLVGAELTLAFILQGLSPMKYIASRDSVSGPIYFASLLAFAVMPALVSRRSDPSVERP